MTQGAMEPLRLSFIQPTIAPLTASW